MNELLVQGDVALQTASLPAGAKKIPPRPLALGEVSGHAHVVVPAAPPTETEIQGFDLFEINGETYVVTGGDGARLEHMKLETGAQADHLPITLAPNTCYRVILQNEYNPESEAFERVLD